MKAVKIDVLADYGWEKTEPVMILWPDGRRFTIDKILSVDKVVPEVFVRGQVFECMIHGARRLVIFDRSHACWYLEAAERS